MAMAELPSPGHVEELPAQIMLRQLEAMGVHSGSEHEMLPAPEAAERYARDPDPLVRASAVASLTLHTKASEASLPRRQFLEHVARTDPDRDVRTMAIAGLARCYTGTNDPRIGQW